MGDQLWKEISMDTFRKQKPPFEGREIVLEIVQNQYQVSLDPSGLLWIYDVVKIVKIEQKITSKFFADFSDLNMKRTFSEVK